MFENLTFKATPINDSPMDDVYNNQHELRIGFLWSSYNTRGLYRNNKRVLFSGSIDTYMNNTTEVGHSYTLKDGLLHSYNGAPAEISYNEKRWYFEGMHHREDGPAQVIDNLLSNTTKYVFFLNGRSYSISDYLQKIDKDTAIIVALKYK